MAYDPLGYYKILETGPDADAQTLKIHYREKAKFWHPDHNKSANALEEFQKISIAYDVLKDRQSRIVYDLLSLAYDTASFPDLKTLKAYHAVDGGETPFLRVFKLCRTIPGLKKASVKEENLIGTFNDALKFIGDITRSNWLKGWWPPTAAMLNIRALKNNYRNINGNREDNFKLLIHNAAVFYSENKPDKARLSAMQAREYALPAQIQALAGFINALPPAAAPIPSWNFKKLKQIQLKIPVILAAAGSTAVLTAALIFLAPLLPETQNDTITYYQEVRFNTGGETVDDMIVSKVFNIPVDTSDIDMLYHVSGRAEVMYGPSEDFDVMDTAENRQTVRVTGYTPDQEWFRIMLDNGEMGFIKKQYLKKGTGKDIPADSKIFQAPVQ